MANKFIEKHKRKSLLAMLLLLFTGRTKYMVIALLVVLTSLPFVVTGEMAGRFFEMPAVSATLRMMGLGSVVSALNPKYSSEFVKAAIDRAAAESAQTFYWNRLMGAAGSMLPCGAGCGGDSSLAMIKGGSDLFQPEAGGKKRSDQVEGAVSAEDKARGDGADAVDLEGILNNPAGGGSGVYGDVMGSNLADRYSAGAAGPYAGRSLGSQPVGSAGGGAPGAYAGSNLGSQPVGSAGGGAPGAYAGSNLGSQPAGWTSRAEVLSSNAVRQADSQIALPGNSQMVNGGKMGKVSAFSWEKVGYRTANAKMDKMDVRLNQTGTIFRLAETFSMTMTDAMTNPNSLYEDAAAYAGATYDGNGVNFNVIQTGTDPTFLPGDAGFAGSQITDAAGLGATAKACTESQRVQGTQMSEYAAAIDKIYRGMGELPECYDTENVSIWNANAKRIYTLCGKFNTQQSVLSGYCQSSNLDRMNCEQYINPVAPRPNPPGMLLSACDPPVNNEFLWSEILAAIVIFMAIAAFMGGWMVPLAATIAGMAFLSQLKPEAGYGGTYKDVPVAQGDRYPGFNTK